MSTYFLIPGVQLEDVVTLRTPQLVRLSRVRSVMSAVCAVAFTVSGTALTDDRLDPVVQMLLFAVVMYSGITLVLDVVSVVRIRRELTARRTEARRLELRGVAREE